VLKHENTMHGKVPSPNGPGPCMKPTPVCDQAWSWNDRSLVPSQRSQTAGRYLTKIAKIPYF